MFDTMTLTKVVGGICGTLLLYLLGGWAAETIYHSGGGGHGDAEQAYVIPVESGDAPAEEVVEVPFAELYAMADAAEGEGVFRNCRACHSLEPGENGTGPSLYGIVGRAVGAEAGFNYSGALSEVAQVWDPETLNDFIENPRGYAPGTSMSFNGVRKAEDRVNLIAYLDSLDD